MIQKLINLFSKFPTVGPRTAARFVYYLIKMPQTQFDEFLESLSNLKKSVKICSSCFNAIENSFCPICQDKTRDSSLLCIVEKETDLESIEKIKAYNGFYFILGGLINLRKNKEHIRIDELKQKVKNGNFKEAIIAINPTPEGETTSLFLERELKEFNLKTTRLGRGLPIGSELEYADEETLSSAFTGRK